MLKINTHRKQQQRQTTHKNVKKIADNIFVPASRLSPKLPAVDCTVHNDFNLPKTADDHPTADADVVLPKLRRFSVLFSLDVRFERVRRVTTESECVDVARDDSP